MVWEGLVLVDCVYVYREAGSWGVPDGPSEEERHHSLFLSCCYLIFVVVTDARAIVFAAAATASSCVAVCADAHFESTAGTCASFAVVAAYRPWFLPPLGVLIAEVALSIILAFALTFAPDQGSFSSPLTLGPKP